MKLWYKKSSLFILAGISYLVGQYFRGEWWPFFTWPFKCNMITSGTAMYCDPKYMDTLGFPLIVLGQTLAIVALILLLANESAFRKWLHFSYWYVPVATILSFMMYPAHTPLGGEVSISQGVYLFGRPYVLITAGIVILYILKFLKRQLRERRLRVKRD